MYNYIRQLYTAPRRDGSPQPPEELAKITRRLRMLGATVVMLIAAGCFWHAMTVWALPRRVYGLLAATGMFGFGIVFFICKRIPRLASWLSLFSVTIAYAGAVYGMCIGDETWGEFAAFTFFYVLLMSTLFKEARNRR
jgi:hypothetical protein